MKCMTTMMMHHMYSSAASSHRMRMSFCPRLDSVGSAMQGSEHAGRLGVGVGRND